MIRPWNYVTSKICGAISHCSDMKPRFRLSQVTYLSTCWGRRRVGDYGYLEAINIEKEYWEARLIKVSKRLKPEPSLSLVSKESAPISKWERVIFQSLFIFHK